MSIVYYVMNVPLLDPTRFWECVNHLGLIDVITETIIDAVNTARDVYVNRPENRALGEKEAAPHFNIIGLNQLLHTNINNGVISIGRFVAARQLSGCVQALGMEAELTEQVRQWRSRHGGNLLSNHSLTNVAGNCPQLLLYSR